VESRSLWKADPCGKQILVESRSLWKADPCGKLILVESSLSLLVAALNQLLVGQCKNVVFKQALCFPEWK